MDILRDVNTKENKLMNNILSQKVKNFGQVKYHSDLEDVVCGRKTRIGECMTLKTPWCHRRRD